MYKTTCKRAWALLLTLLLLLYPLAAVAQEAPAAEAAPVVESISITGKDTVAVGKSITLKAAITPAALKKTKLVWSSSDESIATVSPKGAVKGVNAGTAEITAVAADAGACAASFTVTVTPVIKSIKISGTASTFPGKTVQLTAQVLDSKKNDLSKDAALVWSSSSGKVATVDENGLVTAVSKGKATITASFAGKKAKFKLTVDELKEMTVTSAGIENGVLADKFGMRGSQQKSGVPSRSMPLSFKNLPKSAKCLAIYMYDPDGGNWTHWLAANIPVGDIAENASIDAAANMVQGRNDFGATGYGGPTPPSGTHNYMITVYALSENVSLNSGFGKTEFLTAIKDITITSAVVKGKYAS